MSSACETAASCASRSPFRTLRRRQAFSGWTCAVQPATEKSVEGLLRLQVPTRQEMAEIEESARLYEEQGALVMTAVVINGVAEGKPSRAPVTFVLTKTHLV